MIMSVPTEARSLRSEACSSSGLGEYEAPNSGRSRPCDVTSVIILCAFLHVNLYTWHSHEIDLLNLHINTDHNINIDILQNG